jgi:hypothetical protein
VSCHSREQRSQFGLRLAKDFFCVALGKLARPQDDLAIDQNGVDVS